MQNNIKFNFEFTVSKIGALAIIALSPIFLTGPMILSGWMLAAAMLGVKQGLKTITDVKAKKDV